MRSCVLGVICPCSSTPDANIEIPATSGGRLGVTGRLLNATVSPNKPA